MKRSRSFLLFLFIVLSSFACSAPKTQIEADPNLDLRSYHTFGWLPERVQEKPREYSEQRDDLLDQRIKEQIQAALSNRGLREQAQAPDLRVAYSVLTRTRHVTYPGFHSTRPTFAKLNQGLITVVFIDNKSGELVWRGTAVMESGAEGSEEFHKTVAEILREIPQTEVAHSAIPHPAVNDY